MSHRATLIAALCALAAGCGDSGKEAKKSYQQSFDESFNKSFHEKFVSSCVASAKSGGVAEAQANQLCTCASDIVKERFTVQEKMNLKNDQIMPIVQECRARFPG